MLTQYLDSFEKLIVFLIMLSILVIVHEGGHFWVARWNGVAVTEFAVGFGPAIASVRSKRSGTRYRLNVIPLGGYCAMIGEDARRGVVDDPIGVSGVDYSMRSPWQRLSIVFAGPLVNLIMAFVILVCSTLILGVPSDRSSTRVGRLISGYPAERAGLQTGDKILMINGTLIADGASMVKLINGSLGKKLQMTYLRHGVRHVTTITPVARDKGGQKIGVTGFSPITEYEHISPDRAVSEAWTQFAQMWTATIGGLADLIQHTDKASSEVIGPVGMARAAVAIQDFGPGAFLSFAALISLSLGIFNLLPIPALDGGRILFIFVELVRRRPIDPEKEALVHFMGFAALIAFVVFRTYQDILNMVAGKSAI